MEGSLRDLDNSGINANVQLGIVDFTTEPCVTPIIRMENTIGANQTKDTRRKVHRA
jgi:hypothetical protein